MAFDDRTRLDLHQTLEHFIGREQAGNLMAQLPPIAWSELATKADLEQFATKADLRVEIAGLRTELRGEISELRTEIRTEIAGLRSEMYQGFTRQTRWMVTVMLAWSTALVAAVRLIP